MKNKTNIYAINKGKYSTQDVLLHNKWKGIIGRCYNDKIGTLYIGDKVHVCKEWHNYQTFCDWLVANGGNKKGARLRRDPKSNVYSPSTCKIINKRGR